MVETSEGLSIERPTRVGGRWEGRHPTRTFYTVYIDITNRMSRMGRTGRTSRTVNIIYTVGGHRRVAQAAIVPRRSPMHPALRRRRRCRRLCLGSGPPSTPTYIGACAAERANVMAIRAHSISVCSPMTSSGSCRRSPSQISVGQAW